MHPCIWERGKWGNGNDVLGRWGVDIERERAGILFASVIPSSLLGIPLSCRHRVGFMFSSMFVPCRWIVERTGTYPKDSGSAEGCHVVGPAETARIGVVSSNERGG
jgi:hypothetical protein